MFFNRVFAVFILLIGAVAVPANAAEIWHQSQVQFVYPLGNGSFVLGMSTNSAACPNLENPTKYMWVKAGENGVTVEGERSMLATALVALTTDKLLTVVFDNASSFCYIGRMSLLR